MQISFFDLDSRYASLSKQGDLLERLDRVIDWKLFLPILSRIDIKAEPRKSTAGRPPTCRILMFKMLVLQRLFGLADEKLEFHVTDRLSFMRFLGIDLATKVPDARTVWAFRETIKTRALSDALFEQFNIALAQNGVEMKSGQMIDATFVPVPIQRNGREENTLIKAGAVPIEWSPAHPDNEATSKLAHKDIDARWTMKNNERHYGYKSHINVDRESKLITGQICTDASVHDSQVFGQLLREPDVGGATVHADSAYRSGDEECALIESGHKSQIHERGHRNHPLSEAQKEANTEKSRTRARVEHVFGHQENSMGGIFIRTIGIARAKVNIGLMNLVYNLSRVEFLIRKQLIGIDRVTTPAMAAADKTSPNNP